MTFTAVMIDPCCPLSAPDYDPGPRPVWNRSPGGWPPRCMHAQRTVLAVTEHETESLAENWRAGREGLYATADGYVFEGVMPPEGERFRIMRTGGNLTSGYIHAQPSVLEFPSVDLAREYAGTRRLSLYSIVGDTDTRVRWSSYRVPVGTELQEGGPA